MARAKDLLLSGLALVIARGRRSPHVVPEQDANPGAETAAILLLLFAALCSAAFIVVYAVDAIPHQTQFLGFMAAENCGIQPGQTVAVWGCGPVGQFAIRSAFLLGAGRVIALDNVPERLELARKGGAETLDDEDKDVQEKLRAMTAGRGPDHCIDAVGMEAHGATLDALYDRVKVAAMLETDRSHALRAAIFACAVPLPPLTIAPA